VAAKASSHWPITLTNGATSLLNIFLPLVLVRILSTDQVGKYQIFFLYVALCPGLFLTSGLGNGLYHWAGKYPESKPEVRQSWTLLVALTLIVCSIGLFCSHWLAPLIKISTLAFYCVLLSAPVSLASTFIEDLLIAKGSIWTGSWYSSVFNILKSAAIVLAAWWTRDVLWVFWSFVGIMGVRAMVGWILLHKTGDLKFIFSREKTLNVLRYALPVSLAALTGLALQNLDQIILSFRLNPAKFAFYAVGCLSIPPLLILESSVNRVLIPKLSKAFAANRHSEAAALFAEAVSELFRYLLPATVGLIVFSQPIIRILFTQRYATSANFLQFYALGYLLLSIPYDAAARARADGGWILRMWLIFAPLSLLATWLSTGRWGAMGALISVLIGQFLIRVYSLWYDQKCFHVSLSKFLPLNDMLAQTGIALAAAAGALMMRPLFSDPRTWFLVTGPLFTLLYFSAVYGVFLKRLSTAPGPIRVLELAQTLGLGGLERIVYSLALMLNKHERFKALVVVYDHQDDKPSLASLYEATGIPLFRWQKGKGFSFLSIYRLIQIIFSEKVRVLHAHDLGPLVYGSLVKLLLLGRVKLFFTEHSRQDIEQSSRHQLYYKFFLRFPDRIIAVSPGVKSGLVALGVKPGRIEVIPNGVPFPLSPATLKGPDEKLALRKRIAPDLSPELYSARWMLCMARIQKGKGQDIALDVWSALPPEVRAKLALFFVGQETQAGYVESLRQRIRSGPDPDRIVVIGPSEHPQEWIQSADLFISGALLEGMPLAPLEAAGAGLPILLSDIEGHRFLEPWAHYFDFNKPDDGAKKIFEILETLNREGESAFFENQWNAAASLREKWAESVMTDSYLKKYQSI